MIILKLSFSESSVFNMFLRAHLHEKPAFQNFSSFTRVRTGPGKPGKSWNFILAFSRTGKSWKKFTGPGKSWKFVKLN